MSDDDGSDDFMMALADELDCEDTVVASSECNVVSKAPAIVETAAAEPRPKATPSAAASSAPAQRKPKVTKKRSSSMHDQDALSGHRLSRRFLDPHMEQSITSEFAYVPLEQVGRPVPGTVSDWCTVFVLSDAAVRQAKKGAGRQFSMWSCVSLKPASEAAGAQLLRQPVRLMLFGQAHQEHGERREKTGTIFLLMNPEKMDNSRNYSSNGNAAVTLSIRGGDQLCRIGVAHYFARCKAKRKDGTPCTMPVNTEQGFYCEFHVIQAHKKASAALKKTSSASNAGWSAGRGLGRQPTPSQARANLLKEQFALRTGGDVGLKRRKLDEQRKLLSMQRIAPTVNAAAGRLTSTGATSQSAAALQVNNIPRPAAVQGGTKEAPLSTGERLLVQAAGVPLNSASTDSQKKQALAAHLHAKSVLHKKRQQQQQQQQSTGVVRPQDAVFKLKQLRSASIGPVATSSVQSLGLSVFEETLANRQTKQHPALSALRTVVVRERTRNPVTSKEKLRNGIDPRLPVLTSGGSLRKQVASKSACCKDESSGASRQSDPGSTGDVSPAPDQPNASSVFSAEQLAEAHREADAIQKLRSTNEHLKSKADLRRDRRMEALQDKDQAAQKLHSLMAMTVKAVECLQCARLYESLPGMCKSAGHASKVHKKVTKRFFVCQGCNAKMTTLNEKYPSRNCPGCGASGAAVRAISYAQFRNFAGSRNRGLAERATPNLNHNRSAVVNKAYDSFQQQTF